MERVVTRPEPARAPGVAFVVSAVVLSIIAAAWYFWPGPEAPEKQATLAPVPEGPRAPSAKAAPPHFPIPTLSGPPVAPGPLPALDASDAALAQSLAKLFGAQAFATFFRPEALVRHIVATVDNLPRPTYAQRLSPVHPVGGLLATTGKDDNLVLAPGNAARYAPWVRFAGQVDPRAVVAIYVHFYPLFEQAYAELGYPGGYFNNRLVQVIDHLLEAPAARQPVRLVVRHVLPEFADPELEAQSAGRKILLRIGPDGAAIVKAKLREIRRELTERTPGN